MRRTGTATLNFGAPTSGASTGCGLKSRGRKSLLTRCRDPSEIPAIERAIARMLCSILFALDRVPLDSDFIPEALQASGRCWAWGAALLDLLAQNTPQPTQDDDDWGAGISGLGDCDFDSASGPVDIGALIAKPRRFWILVNPDNDSFHPKWKQALNHSRTARRQLATDTLNWLDQAPDPNPELPVLRNVEFLASALDLGPGAVPLLRWIVLASDNREVRTALADIKIAGYADGCAIVARALGLPEADLLDLYREDRPLRQLALADGDRGRCNDLEDFLALKIAALNGPLRGSYDSEQAFLAAFLQTATPSTLEAAHFPHLTRFEAFAVPLLRNAARTGTHGINVMLYGPPGTGKTEYAKVLAREAGLTLFEVKFGDESGRGLSAQERLSSLILTLQALRSRRDCAVLLDEAEDIFPSAEPSFAELFSPGRRGKVRSPAKAWINRLLEQVAAPVLWTSNTVDQIDGAFLRRFALTIEMGEPPRSVKRRIAEQYLGALHLTASDLDAIAALPHLAPSHLEMAARTARLAASNSSPAAGGFAQQQLELTRRTLGLPRPRTKRNGTVFDPQFIHLEGSPQPEELKAALRRMSRAALCFYGSPGTGKTEFAHYIAQELNRDLIVKLSSDLISPWVGETEQNIARMFADAADQAENVVLLMDEADTFLQDRSVAQRRWEVSQTNEFLAQMDAFPGIFVCTTNLYEGLDTAILRRFQFRLEFLPLTLEQRRELFRKTFDREPPARLDELDALVPADFANLKRQFVMLDRTSSNEGIAESLRREVRTRDPRQGGKRPIGFGCA